VSFIPERFREDYDPPDRWEEMTRREAEEDARTGLQRRGTRGDPIPLFPGDFEPEYWARRHADERP
jgi:hypothetical protein